MAQGKIRLVHIQMCDVSIQRMKKWDSIELAMPSLKCRTG